MLKKVHLFFLSLLLSFSVKAAFIDIGEPVPFGCPSICAGNTILFKIFHVQGLPTGATVQALLSNPSGSFTSGTTLFNCNRYSTVSATGPWTIGAYTFAGDINDLFFEITIPVSQAPGANYNIKFRSAVSPFTTSNTLNLPGGTCSGMTITPGYAPLAAIAPSTIGSNQWIAHAYTWVPTTGSPLTTPALIAQQSFFAQANYKGHFLKDSLNFSLNFTNTTGSSKMPGTVGLVNNGTSFQCGDGYTTNYSLRFYRNQNFTPGFYRFRLAADDGARLSIDGGATWLIDMFTEHALASQNTDAAFPNGVCMNGPALLVIEYFQRPVDAIVKFDVTALSTSITQPQNQTICEGTTTSFSVGTTIPSATYQWMMSSDSGLTYTPAPVGSPFAGTNSSTLQILSTPFFLHNYLFKCIISGICGNAFPSDSAGLTVNPVVAFTSQPVPQIVCVGDTVSFTVATNTQASYQWLENISSGFVFINNTGTYINATTPTLTINGVSANYNNYQYQCIISGCGPSIPSAPASITFAPLQASTQPQNQEVCGTQTLSLSANALNANSYQWQISLDSGLTFTNLIDNSVYQNVNMSDLSILNADASFNGLLYRCQIFGCGLFIYSDTVGIFVKKGVEAEFVPNVFSPNNDGQNDVFKLNTIGLMNVSGSIYNRWGQELYKWSSITDNWDGKFKGTAVNDGVYFYSLKATSECDGKVIEKNGTISLFK
ncbi:MAG: gliding motility-associated C-terminal domain-containing protein [Bacteroidetes bacterium]|nr:gliding motility-associated C-terminal domain-containing protein [Bacteroidota bacterium]